MKKLMNLLILGMFIFSLMSVIAISDNSKKYSITEQHQIENQFQNKYQYNCTGECEYSQEGEKVMLEVKEQKRFLFFNVEAKQNYELNEEGEIVQARYNMWSRLFNQERIKF